MNDIFGLTPKKRPEEEEPNILGQAGQLANVLAKTRVSKGGKNPYSFWKTPIIPGKEGSEGLTLDRAVALAGMLAQSINPPDVYPYSSFGGRLGGQLARYAIEGSKAYEDWETQQKAIGLEERKAAVEERGVAVRERGAAVGERGVAAEERRAAKPTETEILSGIGGPAAREQFIAGQQAIRAPHPSEVALSQARTEVEKETQLLKRKELELVPEEFKMKQVEHKTRLGTMDLEKRRLDLEIEKLGIEKNLLLTGTSKETISAIKSVNQSFDSFVQSWMTKHVYTADDERSNYLKNAELAASVQSHIAGVKSFTNAPEATEKSVRYWFSQVDREMDRPTITGREGIFGIKGAITGAPSQASAEQAARRRYYVRTAANMLMTSGTRSMDMFQTLAVWAAKAGYSDQEIANLLAPFGIRTK